MNLMDVDASDKSILQYIANLPPYQYVLIKYQYIILTQYRNY